MQSEYLKRTGPRQTAEVLLLCDAVRIYAYQAKIKSNYIAVSDRIPDGLEFVGFETTEDGTIGAVARSDTTKRCIGSVIDDTREDTNTGEWNTERTNFYYHGLHYDAATRMVTFNAERVQAGCELSVGIITKTPALGTANRIDFYNTANVKSGLIDENSNTVHAWIGKGDVEVYKVTYRYTGDIPASAPDVSGYLQQYAESASVGVMPNPSVSGYTFSGWSTDSVETVNGSFVMPNHDVELVGMFTEASESEKFKVSYLIEGDAPAGYMAPREKKYVESDLVSIDSTETGTVIDGYTFEGWTSADATLTESGFVMPDHDVVIKGTFERIGYTVSYEFEGSVIPPNPGSLLPASTKHYPGDTVTTASKPEAEGYRFVGWYKNDTFTMPEADVVIQGEWSIQNGLFAPEIEKIISNPQDKYHKDDIVEFEITVKNTAEYTIRDVQILEKLDGAAFIENDAYMVKTDQYALISEIPASETVKLYAQYEITENETKHYTNTVVLAGAIADNYYNFDTSRSYQATVEFDAEKQVTPITIIEDILSPQTGDGIVRFIGIFAGSVVLLVGYILGRRISRKHNLAKAFGSKVFILAGCTILAASAVYIVITTFAAPAGPVPSVDLTSQNSSYENGDPGAWNVTKSAKWTGLHTAQVTFQVDSIRKEYEGKLDVLFVLDVSGSMSGEKLERVKEDASELADYLLNAEGNRAALITFNSGAVTQTGFTTEKEDLLNTINGFTALGGTNYYDAFKNAGVLLKDYEKQPDRELMMLFLTDGYPCVDTPNETEEYKYLKKMHPYIQISGIQYEMGSEILDTIKQVSDSQYPADMLGLKNVLFDAADVSYLYNEFVITDLVNNEYFGVESVVDIKATNGKVFLDTAEDGTPRVTWKMNNALRTGKPEILTINLTLKEEYDAPGEGLYPTNKGVYISSKLTDVPDEDIFSASTPILKRNYTVHYEGNAPSDCTVSGLPQDETYAVFETVEVSNVIPVCSGYSFRGFELATENVEKYNEDFFVMPESDVILRATWDKVSIEKRMEGSVYVALTMQNFSCSSLEPDETVELIDTRENGINSYIVGKAADGNCWMLQNLKLGSSVEPGGEIIVAAVNNATGEIQDTFTLSGKVVEGGKFSYSGNYTNDYPQFVCEDDFGCYYNWTAATARTGLSSTITGDASASICPTGWSLPSANQLSSLVAKYHTYSLMVNSLDNYNTTGANPGFTLGGGYTVAGHNQTDVGMYWTRTVTRSERYGNTPTNSAIELRFINNFGGMVGFYDSYKFFGKSIRCVSL